MSFATNYAILCVAKRETLRTLSPILQSLDGLPYVLEMARNPTDALDRIGELEEEEVPIGILIVQENMDELSGPDFLRMMESTHPHTVKILISQDSSLQTVIPLLNETNLSGIVEPSHAQESFSQLIKRIKRRFDDQIKTEGENRLLSTQVAELERKLSERTTELLKKNLELQKLSSTDALTRLPNRMKLDERFHSALKQAERYQVPLSIILLDLDHFKAVNDEYGHQMGDNLLVHLAHLLEQNIRDTDTIGRWGGEEFLLICPGIDLNQAERFSEKLRRLIAETPFDTVGYKTASFGIAEYAVGDSETTLLERADKALYKAKNAGRNTIVVG